MSINLSNLTMYRVSAGSIIPLGDPYWSSVSLLTETTGTNGQDNLVFLDSSSNARTIFNSGSPTQGTFSPFAVANGSSYSPATNGGSGYFVNGDVYVSNGPYSVAGNFTAECWFYRTGTGAGLQYIFAEQNSGTYFGVQSGGAVFGSMGGSMLFSDGASVVTMGAWHHLVMVRSGSNVAAFVDGTRVATATSSAAFQYQFIGGLTTGSFTSNAYGYLSNCRIVNSAVYNPSNTTITVPTAPLTAISGTQLLMNFTNAGIYDAAAENNLFTISGPTVSTAQKKFGTTSIFLNGAGALTTAGSSNFGYGTSDFTIEFWFRGQTNAIPSGYLYAQNGSVSPYLRATSGQLIYGVGNSPGNAEDKITVGAALTFNVWYHAAVSRSGSSTKLFLNGTQIGSTYTASDNFAVPTTVALGSTTTPNDRFAGFMQYVRVTKGVARYTANFTAPTEPFPTN